MTCAPAIGLFDWTSRTSPSARTKRLPGLAHPEASRILSAAARMRPPLRAVEKPFAAIGSLPRFRVGRRRAYGRAAGPERFEGSLRKCGEPGPSASESTVQHGARNGASELLERALLGD